MKKIKKVVVISKSLLTELVKISKNSIVEDCGIFLGYNDDSNFEIKKFIQDKINQFGTGSSTIRQTKNIYDEYQEILNKDNSIDYIGEWHSHPMGKISPSYFDNFAMKFLLNHPKYSYPKELILGIINSKVGLRIFMYQYGIQKMKELSLKII